MSFVVVKHGIYMHDVCGPFDTFDEAKERADALARADKDSYHEYCVWPLTKEGISGQREMYSVNKKSL